MRRTSHFCEIDPVEGTSTPFRKADQGPAEEIRRSEFPRAVHRKPWTLLALSHPRFGADSGRSRERQLCYPGSIGVHHEDVFVHARHGAARGKVDVPPVSRPGGRTAEPRARQNIDWLGRQVDLVASVGVHHEDRAVAFARA